LFAYVLISYVMDVLWQNIFFFQEKNKIKQLKNNRWLSIYRSKLIATYVRTLAAIDT
jgi:hypothetical protein